jgi:glyoxylase-like metal-dependent hydrolase (beta-lactamase superfamily II)
MLNMKSIVQREPVDGVIEVQSFFDAETASFSYVLWDPASGDAAIVDPVLGFELSSARTNTAFADDLIRFVEDRRLTLVWLLETHIHADHVTAATYIKDRLGGRIGIGRGVATVAEQFAGLFGQAGPDTDCFDHLFDDGETITLGTVTGEAMLVPGHTPADTAYRFADMVFVGDTLFMPDCGTARADFPGGDAVRLGQSIGRLLALPAATRLMHCHDYPPDGRAIAACSTVADQKSANIHVRDGVTLDAFARMRSERDATLALPRLMLPAVQLNIRAGRLPDRAANGLRYLQLPIDVPAFGGGSTPIPNGAA